MANSVYDCLEISFLNLSCCKVKFILSINGRCISDFSQARIYMIFIIDTSIYQSIHFFLTAITVKVYTVPS